MNINLEIIAFIASTLGIGGSLPQILKILRTKETRALSYGNYIMVSVGSMTWVLYGLVAPVYSIIVWNSISTVLALSVITLKIRNEKPKLITNLIHHTHTNIPARMFSVLLAMCMISSVTVGLM